MIVVLLFFFLLVVVLVGFSFLLSFLSPVKGSTVVGFFFFEGCAVMTLCVRYCDGNGGDSILV